MEGITLAAAVTGRVLLDATASLTWGAASECDDVTGAARAGCVLGAGQAMVFSLLSLEGGSSVAIRTRRACLFRARPASSCTRCPTCPGPGPLKRAVGRSFPPVVRDAGELVGPVGVGRGGATRLSSTLGTRTPAKAGGVQMRLAGTA